MRTSIAGLAVMATLLGFSCNGLIDGTGETGYRDIGTSGGDVRAKDTVVSVPEGAVDHTERLTITPAPAEELPMGSAGLAVDLGPDGMQFTTPVKVQLAFDPAALPDPSRPDLVWIGTVVDGEWEPLADTEVNLETNTVSGTTLHFSRYGVVHGCGEGRRCATRISISSPAQRVAQGACSGRVGIRLLDEHERLAPVQHDTGLRLTSSRDGVAFYSDEACLHETHELAMARGTSETRFFFKGSSAGAFAVTVAARDLRPASQEDAIVAPTTTHHLTFVSARQSVGIGACSAATTVELQNGANEPVPVAAELPLSLSTVGSVGVSFFSDAACSVPTSQVAIPAGASQASFYFRIREAAQANFVLVATTGELIGRQEASITPAAAAGLRFHSLAQTVGVDHCSGLTLLGAVDSAGNRTWVTTTTTVSLASSAAGIQLYSDSACTTAISSVTLTASELSAGFYFKGSAAGSYTLTATADGLTAGSQAETITAVTPRALSFTSAPQRVAVGACSSIAVIGTVDASGAYAPVAEATSVSLSSDSRTISYYSDASCTVAVTSITIPGGLGRAGFYFKDTAVETINITAAATSLSSATQANSFFN